MKSDAELIAEYIALYGVTKCPTLPAYSDTFAFELSQLSPLPVGPWATDGKGAFNRWIFN